MSIKDRFMADLKVAMREKNTLVKDTITMARAAVKQIEVDQRIEMDDSGIIEIIAKQIKQKKGAIEEFEKGSRIDLADQAREEIIVLMAYLPEPLSAEELKAIVLKAVQDTGATTVKEMGKVVSAVMPQVVGRADGKVISEMVKALLS